MEIENFEDKLKNSNELFFKVFENNSIGLIFADLETTRYLYVNNSFLESTGYSKNELVGKTALELKLIEPIFRNENLAILRQQGELNNLETLINKKNGGVFWALTSVQIIILQDKKYALTSFIDITAQKKLEEQFSQLAAIVEFSEDAIFSTSLDGIIKNWNNGAEKIYGYSSKEAIGNHISMIIPSEFLNEEKEINKRILNNEIVKHYETVRINKKGEQLNISLSASPLKDGDGKIIGISVIARDITFKKKSEKELIDINAKFVLQTGEKEKRAAELVIADIELDFQNKEKEKREIVNKELEALSHSAKIASQYARSLIEASLDPLVTISVEGKITDVNEASVKVTGEKREKLIGTDFSDYFTEPERAREGYKQVFEKGFVSDYPLTIRHKNGKLTDVLYNASVYKDDKGNVLGVFAAARDVTDQKISEENLRKSLKEISDYKYALDEFSIVAITDQKGIIKHANDNFCKISKYTIDELIGQDHRIINSGYHPKEFIRDLWTTISSGNIWRGDLKNKAKDGTIYWVATTIVPFLDEQGKPYQYVSVRTDITDQKRFATELTEAKIFAELATGIAEEAQSKAESATRIAEDAMKAKQQFLSNMSHEIRTPMNAIIGFTKVVLKTDLLPKQKEYLQAIKVSGDALIVLINDILDLAKVDAGKMTFEQTPFKMASSISAMLHLFEPKIQEQNLILVKEYDINIPDVLVGDPVRLNQIVLNLVSNAVKFTTKGTITVSVKLLNEDEEKATIEFVVKDTGIGINSHKVESIFENFQQATSGTSRLYGGTGLGLAIVKQLVEQQGGSINVKSKIDEGSAFSFILSFNKTKAMAESEIDIVELDEEIKNIKVLVVEDIALNQLLMKTLLDDFGFGCDMASNGKIAIEKVQNNYYDIILMDLQMPEMNGFEATEFIRNELKSKTPIIALTADVTTVDLAKCKAVGMNDYLAKPIDEKLLYSKIAGFVKKPHLNSKQKEKKNKVTEKIKYTDLNYLMHRTKSNPALMMEMISLYLEQTPPLISAMKKSLHDKDWNILYATVHKMIPSFSIVGISRDYENVAKKAQEYASTKQLEGIHELVGQLETILTQACIELEEEYNMIKNKN